MVELKRGLFRLGRNPHLPLLLECANQDGSPLSAQTGQIVYGCCDFAPGHYHGFLARSSSWSNSTDDD